MLQLSCSHCRNATWEITLAPDCRLLPSKRYLVLSSLEANRACGFIGGGKQWLFVCSWFVVLRLLSLYLTPFGLKNYYNIVAVLPVNASLYLRRKLVKAVMLTITINFQFQSGLSLSSACVSCVQSGKVWIQTDLCFPLRFRRTNKYHEVAVKRRTHI